MYYDLYASGHYALGCSHASEILLSIKGSVHDKQSIACASAVAGFASAVPLQLDDTAKFLLFLEELSRSDLLLEILLGLDELESDRNIGACVMRKPIPEGESTHCLSKQFRQALLSKRTEAMPESAAPSTLL